MKSDLLALLMYRDFLGYLNGNFTLRNDANVVYDLVIISDETKRLDTCIDVLDELGFFDEYCSPARVRVYATVMVEGNYSPIGDMQHILVEEMEIEVVDNYIKNLNDAKYRMICTEVEVWNLLETKQMAVDGTWHEMEKGNL